MRSRTEQTLLKILAETVVDGQRDDERSHAGRNSGNRNAGDHTDKGLAALGTQVARRNEEFKFHENC